jgi:hypothetical protein
MTHLPDVYIIVNISDLPSVDFSQVAETSEQTIRKSLDGTLFVLKYESGHEPTFISDGTIVPTQSLDHAGVLTLMATAEWSEPIPVE